MINENHAVLSKKPVVKYIPKKVVSKGPLIKMDDVNPKILDQEKSNKGKEILIDESPQVNPVLLVGETSNPPSI